MKIQVTQLDIDRSWKGSYNCPIACAVVRQTGHPACVSHVNVTFWRQLKRVDASLPLEATQFIAAYDSKQPVEPFEFELDIPESLV